METAHDQIMAEIKLRLRNISARNGYFNSVKSLKRAMLTPFKGYDLPAVNFWSTGMLNADEGKYKKDDRNLTVMIEMHTKTWEPGAPFDSVAAKMAADIVTAINRSPNAPKVSDDLSPKLGGIVLQCKFDRYDNTIGEGQSPWVGVLVTFLVRFLADNHDMFNFK